MNIELNATVDIAKSLGGSKRADQILVGFALETNDAIANAQKKLVSKNLDIIVLNSLADSGAGFNVDTNKITIIDKQNKQKEFALKDKEEVACDIIDELEGLMIKKSQ